MDAWLRTLRERIWPSRPGVRRSPSLRDGLATLIALLFLVMVVGPDLLVYIELSTMLDCLGAALFVLAFAMGLKLLALSLARQLRSALPPEDLVLWGARPGATSSRALWVGLIAFRALRVYMPIAVCIAVLGLLLGAALSHL